LEHPGFYLAVVVEQTRGRDALKPDTHHIIARGRIARACHVPVSHMRQFVVSVGARLGNSIARLRTSMSTTCTKKK
jgi:hypothetical protein